MIHIEKDQIVPDSPELRVFSPTGDYDDSALIECYRPDSPELGNLALHAQFIKYGRIVYKFNEPEELGEALSQIDPQSTHKAVLFYAENKARKVKQQDGTLQPETPVGNKENISQPTNPETPATPVVTPPVSETVPPVTPPVEPPTPAPTSSDPGISTTTPPVVVPPVIAPEEPTTPPEKKPDEMSLSTTKKIKNLIAKRISKKINDLT